MDDYEIEQAGTEQWVVTRGGEYLSTFATEEEARDAASQMASAGGHTMQEQGVQARPHQTPRPTGPGPGL